MEMKDYLDRALERLNLSSVYALSIELGIGSSRVNMWKNGKFHPSDDAMLKIADAADVPPERALADLNAWRVKSDAARAVYRRMAEKIAVCVVVALFGIGHFNQASAANGWKTNPFSSGQNYALCDKTLLVRLYVRARNWLYCLGLRISNLGRPTLLMQHEGR